MDSNKNEQCCYNTNTNGGRIGAGRSAGIIETGCLAKAVSAAKYQNQFNNNNLIEQENLMPSVKDDEPPTVMTVGQNGAAVGLPGELHAKEKIFVNGSSRNVNAIFPTSPSPSSSSARNASEERVPSGQPNVECLTNTTSTSFTPTINGTVPGYSRAINSTTIPETVTRGPLESSTTTTGAGGPSERRDELTLEAAAKGKPDDGSAGGVGVGDDGEFSDNNSIGNLSYISENGLIEEIILLPSNAYSDDDNGSASDDCIYAYRGGEPGGAAGLLLELRGDQPPDDETDFLEMDFDPEPSSEMENFDSSQREPVLEEDPGVGGAASSGVRANETQHLQQEAGTSSGPRSPHVGPIPPPKPVRGDMEPSHQNESLGPMQPALGGDHAHQNGSMGETVLVSRPLAKPSSLPDPIAVVSSQKGTAETIVKEIHDTGGNSVPAKTKHEPDEQPVNRSQAHKTGAIPKAVPPHHYANAAPDLMDRGPVSRCSSNAKNLKLDLNLCLDEAVDGDAGAKRRYLDHLLYYEPRAYRDGTWADELVAGDGGRNADVEFYCSECGTLEFTRKLRMDREPDSWMCKNCAFAQGEKLSRRRTDSFRRRADEIDHRRREPAPMGRRSEAEALDLRAEQLAMEALSKINTLKEMPPSSGQQQEELQYGRSSGPKEPLTWLPQDQEVPNAEHYQHGVGICPENTVTIYTINCGELTIIEALTRIGIAPNLDVLRQYFNEQYECDTSKMNIPQYLLHMSKRDCNYKKLIEAIKSCCDDEALDVQYYPLDPFSDTPEIVQISSGEIAKRWNANTNLRQIIHFKHKHFHTLNVLGKIVNIIRQPSRGRHTTHTIGIPQYYKSGSITITRTAGSS